MGKSFTRSIGAGFALAIAAATFSPAFANAADTGEVSVPRVAEIAEAQAAENGHASITMVAGEDADENFDETIAVTVNNLVEAYGAGDDTPVDWHCYAYVNADGSIPEDLAQQFEDGGAAGAEPASLLSTGAWANNHDGPADYTQNLDTSALEDGTYTVASVCQQGTLGGGDTKTTVVSGTQNFTLSTPATGSLDGLGLGSLGGSDSLGGGSADNSGSAGNSGSMAALGSLVLGGGIAAGIHAHNTGLI